MLQYTIFEYKRDKVQSVKKKRKKKDKKQLQCVYNELVT